MTAKLSVLMVVALVAGALLAGCETGKKGPTPEEQIRQAITDWTAAAQAKDVAKMMTFLAQDFSSSEWPDKESYEAFVKDSVEMGYIDDMEVDTTNMKVTFEGEDKAVAAPIDISASFGVATLSVVFEEEDGKWLISDLTMDM